MERASMKYIRWMLAEINRIEGRPTDPSHSVEGRYTQNPGCLVIDHNAAGYKIEEMLDHGVTDLTSLRMTRRELQYFLEGWLGAINPARSRSAWHQQAPKSA